MGESSLIRLTGGETRTESKREGWDKLEQSDQSDLGDLDLDRRIGVLGLLVDAGEIRTVSGLLPKLSAECLIGVELAEEVTLDGAKGGFQNCALEEVSALCFLSSPSWEAVECVISFLGESVGI